MKNLKYSNIGEATIGDQMVMFGEFPYCWVRMINLPFVIQYAPLCNNVGKYTFLWTLLRV